jgi:hypothetical protein
MNARPCSFAGDRRWPSAMKPSLAVCRHRKLERHVRSAVANAADMAGMRASRLLCPEAHFNRYAGRTQSLVPASSDLRIRILQR